MDKEKEPPPDDGKTELERMRDLTRAVVRVPKEEADKQEGKKQRS